MIFPWLTRVVRVFPQFSAFVVRSNSTTARRADPRGQVRLSSVSQNMSPCGFLNFSSQSRSRLLSSGYADTSSFVDPDMLQQQDERPSRKAKKENKVCSFPSSSPPIHPLFSSTAFSQGPDLAQDQKTTTNTLCKTPLPPSLAPIFTRLQTVAQESPWLFQAQNHPPVFNPDPYLRQQQQLTPPSLLQLQKHVGSLNHL